MTTEAGEGGPERLLLPHATGWSEEAEGGGPLAPFVRIARRSGESRVALLVVEDAAGLQLHALSGEPDGEALPVSVIRALMRRTRRSTVQIPDLGRDKQFAAAPQEEREAGFVAFVGATVRNPAGEAVGVLCLLDRRQRRWTRDVLLTLSDLARGAGALLASRRDGQAGGSPESATGLPGRQALDPYLAQALSTDPAGTGSTQGGLALFRIDFGRLAALNEMYGRDVADRFLRHAADRLQSAAPIPSLLAHLGGSAFALAAPGRVGASDAEATTLRLMERLHDPIQVGELSLSPRLSIGVALSRLDADDADGLVLAAEAALAEARRLGEDRHCRASRALTESYALSTGMEQDLRLAVRDGAFRLNWMPVIDTASERVVSFEALVRWTRPGHGEIAPGLFIPVAEAAGLIEQIDAWVLRAACLEAQGWEQALGVSVNVSSRWLSGGRLVRLLRRVLGETGLSPTRLQIELSDIGLVGEDGTLRRELAQVRAIGVRLALDDFGTSQSSLSALTSYPFDQVKLDRQFVRSLGQDRRAEAITRSVLQMVQALGMTSCAEGVETEAQLAFLDAHGCEEVQGYLIGLPVQTLPVSVQNLADRASEP